MRPPYAGSSSHPPGYAAWVPTQVRLALLGCAVVVGIACIVADAGPGMWLETMMVRWVRLRVPVLSGLTDLLVPLMLALGGVSALGWTRARAARAAASADPARALQSTAGASSDPQPVVPDAGVDSVILASLLLLVALPLGLQTCRTADDHRAFRQTAAVALDARAHDTPNAPRGAVLTLRSATSSACEVSLVRLARGGQSTVDRWRALSPVAADRPVAWVGRQRVDTRTRADALLPGAPVEVAGRVPRSIRTELARRGCTLHEDARVLIPSRGTPRPPWHPAWPGAITLVLVALAIVALVRGHAGARPS